VPPWHPCPQVPQFAASVAGSTQVPEHAIAGVVQLPPVPVDPPALELLALAPPDPPVLAEAEVALELLPVAPPAPLETAELEPVTAEELVLAMVRVTWPHPIESVAATVTDVATRLGRSAPETPPWISMT
jgi:hypothetical protein